VAYGTSLTAVGAWVNQLSEVFNQQFPGTGKPDQWGAGRSQF